jgi:fatty acid desaturase
VLISGLVLATSASRPFGGHQPLECLIQLVASTRRERQPSMLWTIALILIVLWVLGLVSSYTLGGFLHILLVLAIVVILIRVIQGRRIA